MKKYFNTIISLLSGILLLLILWSAYGVLFIYSFQNKAPELHYSIPNKADLVVELDGRDVAFDFLNSTFIKGKGEDIIHLMKKLNKTKSEQKEYGINWLQPVVYFKTTYKNQPIQGVIVQIINPKEWERNSADFFGKGSFSENVNNSGIIVQSVKLSKKDLANFTKSLYHENTILGKAIADNHIITVRNKSKTWSTEFEVFIDDSAINTSGTADFNESYSSNSLNFKLTPSDLHFSSDIITKELSDSLQRLIGTRLRLSGISMNYRGMTITDINNQMVIIPDADFVLGFNDSTSILQLVESIPNAVLNDDNTQIHIGEKTFYIRQLNCKSIYLGTNTGIEVHPNKQHFGILLTGSLKPLVKIEASRFIKAIIRMSSHMALGVDLSNEIEQISFQLRPINEKSYELKSTIQFHADEATLSILKIILKNT